MANNDLSLFLVSRFRLCFQTVYISKVVTNIHRGIGIFGGLAQLVERVLSMHEVSGSIPEFSNFICELKYSILMLYSLAGTLASIPKIPFFCHFSFLPRLLISPLKLLASLSNFFILLSSFSCFLWPLVSQLCSLHTR